eukprot:TRINITY_DN2023_c0_g1_i2.p2 TRINITY_DN2023_c0_g1~~TRINITY_DN2023_c0_g1_i2.p2  ORF type:complete len:121 (-),score=3.22 TRINITY_DN2023_c0_g1_i2:276-638(-)
MLYMSLTFPFKFIKHLKLFQRKCMGKSRRGKGRKAQTPGMFEVEEITPPKRSLGIHCFHPNTHCGEEIEVEGQGYVVSCVVLRYKLERGKYIRDHNKLEVQKTPRYFLNLMLNDLYEGAE